MPSSPFRIVPTLFDPWQNRQTIPFSDETSVCFVLIYHAAAFIRPRRSHAIAPICLVPGHPMWASLRRSHTPLRAGGETAQPRNSPPCLPGEFRRHNALREPSCISRKRFVHNTNPHGILYRRSCYVCSRHGHEYEPTCQTCRAECSAVRGGVEADIGVCGQQRRIIATELVATQHQLCGADDCIRDTLMM